MRSALSFLLLMAGAAALAQLAGVTGTGRAPAGRDLVFEGTHDRWLVKSGSADRGDMRRALSRLGGGKAGGAAPGGWREVRLSSEVAAADAEAAFAAAGAQDVEPVLPRQIYAEPDVVGDPARPTSSEPAPDVVDDPPGAFDGSGDQLRSGPTSAPRLGEQWALRQTNDVDIDGVEAWSAGTGSGSVVAIIDTGVDASHPDLLGRVLEGRDFSGSSTGAGVDRVGHGTQVASIVAAGGAGMAGVAPDAKILPLKVFRDSPSDFSMSGYLSAIRYAADAGADVINISLGCGGTESCFSQAEHDAIAYAAEKGVLVVAAAGNGDRTGHGMNNDAATTPDYPSGYELPNIVSATASTRLGNWSTWANYGSQTVDLAAPGEGILVAVAGGGYRTVTGTSFSAPHVAAVAAAIAGANTGVAPDDIRARMLATVDRSATLQGRSVSGGILNSERALRAVSAGGAPAAGPVVLAPRDRVVLRSLPLLTWSLPQGWKTVRVQLRSGGHRFDRPLPATRRAFAHPAAAWQAGGYTWQVVARAPSGALVTSRARTYRIAPRFGAWVSSGRITAQGRQLRLRVGYASNQPRPSTRVTILAGSRVLHSGPSRVRTAHAAGVGTPRRAWFEYRARLGSSLRAGQRVTVVVRVGSGRASLTRRFSARVR